VASASMPIRSMASLVCFVCEHVLLCSYSLANIEITVSEEMIKLKIEHYIASILVLKNAEIRVESTIDNFDAALFAAELSKTKSIPLSLHAMFTK
jgi:hypothetical protein